MRDVPTLSARRYEQLRVGERWGPFTERLDRAASDRLRGALCAPSAGDAAPVGVLPLLTLRALRRALAGIVPGGVLIRQHLSLLEPIPSEALVSTTVWVLALQERPSGHYTTFAFTIEHDGRAKAHAEWVILAHRERAEDAG
jgi:hypothetical protein